MLTSIILPPSVTFLECYQNQLTALDVSGCPNLTHLATGINPITSLDVSANPLITLLNANDMPVLSYLNVSNGNNTNFTTFNAYGNPNLTCIQVDSVEYSDANWTSVDSIVNFSEYCSPASTNNYASKIEVVIFPNPTSDFLNISSDAELNTNYTIIDISGRMVANGNMQGNNSILNIENLINGIYFLQIGEQNSTIFKFIKN